MVGNHFRMSVRRPAVERPGRYLRPGLRPKLAQGITQVTEP
jgi:hypothetical protein